eukprot:1489927-Alexandrium_andersonii.AAC.1
MVGQSKVARHVWTCAFAFSTCVDVLLTSEPQRGPDLLPSRPGGCRQPRPALHPYGGVGGAN